MVIQESIKACLTASPDDHQLQLQPRIRIFHHGCPVHVVCHPRHPTTTGATCSNPLSITISHPYSTTATSTTTANVYVFSTPTFSPVAPFHSINHTVTSHHQDQVNQNSSNGCGSLLCISWLQQSSSQRLLSLLNTSGLSRRQYAYSIYWSVWTLQ